MPIIEDVPNDWRCPFCGVKSIAKLRMKDKFRLWELLDEQMAHAEEKAWEEDPSV
jgi:DNA-directed RNA polymerase subunit RPC12/RpoP